MQVGGSRKPLHRQLNRGGGRFTCGLCSRRYRHRSSLNRHKVLCFSDRGRVLGLLSQLRLRNGASYTMTEIVDLKRRLEIRRGPRLRPYYECKLC